MRLSSMLALLCLIALVATASVSAAQDFRGRINGTVTDNSGAVLPGVTVTASSPALIQPQVQVSGAAGDYRFVALPPGVYDITFELSGLGQRFPLRNSPCRPGTCRISAADKMKCAPHLTDRANPASSSVLMTHLLCGARVLPAWSRCRLKHLPS